MTPQEYMLAMQNGLLGQPQSYGGLLDDQQQRAAQSNGLINFGASLLANSAPSATPQSFGRNFGQAAIAGRSAQAQSTQDAINAALLKRQIMAKEQKPLVAVKPGEVLYDPNTSAPAYTAPAEAKPYKPQDPLAQLEEDRRQGLVSPEDYAARKQLLLTRAPPIAVNVSTDKKFGEALAGKMAEQYSAQYDAAQNATEAIASSARVRDLLKTVPYTGAGADYKLAFGKAAKAAGFDYGGDDISNTELLAKELGQNVLNNVKSSGLAGSQGLTEGERKFLLAVVGGTINLDNKTLGRIADLNERTARNAIKKWNATAGRLDKGTLQSLGMGTIDEGAPSNNMGNGWSIEPVK